MQDLHSYICVGYCKGTMHVAVYPPTYSQKVNISRGAWIPKMDMSLFWCSNAVNSCQYSNPRRACAARVIMRFVQLRTRIYVCVCLLSAAVLALQVTWRPLPTTAELREPEKHFAATGFESEKLARSRTELRGPIRACVCAARLGAELTSTRSARSVYLERTRSHNEGYVSTPPCYLLF